jgi:hypothetical protein
VPGNQPSAGVPPKLFIVGRGQRATNVIVTADTVQRADIHPNMIVAVLLSIAADLARERKVSRRAPRPAA